MFAVSPVFSKASRQYVMETEFCLCLFVNPSRHLSMSLVFNCVRGTLVSPSSFLCAVSLVIFSVPVPSRACDGVVKSPVMWPGSVCGPGASLVLRLPFLFLYRLILLLFLVSFQFLMFLLRSILLLFLILRILRICPLSPRTVLPSLHLILSLMFRLTRPLPLKTFRVDLVLNMSNVSLLQQPPFRFLILKFLSFRSLHLCWGRGSIPWRVWRAGAPPLGRVVFCSECLAGSALPTGGPAIRLKNKKLYKNARAANCPGTHCLLMFALIKYFTQ